MERLIKEHIEYFSKLYLRTLLPEAREVVLNLKKLKEEYAREDNPKPKNRKVLVKWC